MLKIILILILLEVMLVLKLTLTRVAYLYAGLGPRVVRFVLNLRSNFTHTHTDYRAFSQA